MTSDQEILSRLEKRTQFIDGHRLWTGSLTAKGYGQIRIDGILFIVSRLSLYLFKEFDINSNLEALHIDDKCRFRNCWEPEHLYSGTYLDNARDHKNNTTHCKRGHEYTRYNTIMTATGKRCRICKNMMRNKLYDSGS